MLPRSSERHWECVTARRAVPVAVLIQKLMLAGENKDLMDKDRKTALMIAAEYGDMEVVQVLL